MRYWDASALVPLLVDEAQSGLIRDWLDQDSQIVTSVRSRTKIVSAIERRVRQRLLTRSQRRQVLARLHAFAGSWDAVTDALAVRSRATTLLGRHALRAADAGQLGAALLVSEQLAGTLAFACLDQRLASAAELEGLAILP